MKATHGVAFALVIIGGLNWLLVGLFTWDIGVIFGGASALIPRIIYILVGLSAIYLIVTHKTDCKHCEKVTTTTTSTTSSTPAGNPM